MELLNKLLSVDLNYIVIGLMVLFYSLEQIVQTQFKFNKRPQHLFHNLLLQGLFILVSLAWATVAVFSIGWLNRNEVGLFYLVDVPFWPKLILSVAMFDFVTYWFHRTSHLSPLLWRLHRVHHSDTSVDASTNFRGHPIEIAWFGTSNIVAAGIFGLDLFSLGVYFLIVTPLFFLEHSNLKFPAWLDRTVGWVFTTPNVHKIHHDQDQYYTDSNFADIFILWDRIFGTYRYKPTADIKFGLKEFDEERKQQFLFLLKSPFLNFRRVSSEELRKGK